MRLSAHSLVQTVALAVALACSGCSSAPSAADGSTGGGDAPRGDTRPGDRGAADGKAGKDSVGPRIVEKVLVGEAASLPVVIDLLTTGQHQFVAYYNKDRFLTVASRTLGSTQWTSFLTTSKVPWDGHNYVTLALDEESHLHVAGNMHNSPLNYYRTTRALDVTSLAKVKSMVGTEEVRVTYPTFLHGPKGELVFHYRSGLSGDGVTIFNRYAPAKKKWTRLLDKPLFNNPGMNAYPHGPVQLAGVFHVAWVWRDTPDNATTHDPSYARSKDLIHWTRADGTPLTLPLNMKNGEVVDAVPTKAGLENFNTKVSVDKSGRPIVSYHKWDAAGDTQLYNARFEGKTWKVYQTSNWKGRYLPGSSTAGLKLYINPIRIEADGGLSQAYYHWKQNTAGRSTNWRLDAATLKPSGTYPFIKNIIRDLVYKPVTSPYPGMRAASIISRGDTPEQRRYFLRWEVVDSKGSAWPPATDLHVYKLTH